jgi:hypothetical protein
MARLTNTQRKVNRRFFDHATGCRTLTRMNRSICRLGLLGVAIQLWALNIWAQPYTVRYVAPAGCPGIEAFELAVQARGANVNAVAADGLQGEAKAALFVNIERGPDGYEGRVSLHEDGAAGKARTARSARCEEVVDAMALVTTLTLENERVPDPEPLEQPVPQRQAAVAVAAAPSATNEAVAAPRVFEGSTPARFNVHDATHVEAGTVHVDGLKTLTLAGGALFGVLPGVVLPRISATFVTTQFLTLPDGSQSLVGAIPLMRLSYLGPGRLRRGNDTVELDGFLGGAGAGLTLGVCTTPHYNSNGWAFLLCAETGGKLLSLRAQGDDVSLDRTAPFLDFALSMSAQYHFSSHFHATLAAEGGAQIGEAEVKAASDDPAISVGAAVGSLSFGIGVLF